MSSLQLTRDFCNQRSNNLELQKVVVEVDLRTIDDPNCDTFSVTSNWFLRSKDSKVIIDFLGKTVTQVIVNGAKQTVQYDGQQVTIEVPVDEDIELSVSGLAFFSRSGEGLHRFFDPKDGKVYSYTQYEPADSCKVFPVFDQPDLKTNFQFKVIAPADWFTLSNREAEAVNKVEGKTTQGLDLVEHVFAPTLKQSSYITALVCGPYACFEDIWAGKGAKQEDMKVPLRLFCRQSMASRMEAEDIFIITKQGLDYFNKAFGISYPWGKYDQIFVPEYNLGAMENPGCVTFTENYLPIETSRRDQARGRANTILHEMSHMWFGDLVTPQWWDDLWLKESFAEFMGADASVKATRFTEAWLTSNASRATWALAADEMPTTHPIVADVPDLEAANSNFDGITYAKGAAALKSLVNWVGETSFYEATKNYFCKHAYACASISDFLAEISLSTQKDLQGWANAWILTPGTSSLDVEIESDICIGDSATEKLHITQSCIDNRPGKEGTKYLRPHRFTVGQYVLGISDNDIPEIKLLDRREVELNTESVDLEFSLPKDHCNGEQVFYLLNDTASTFARVHLDERSQSVLLNNLKHLSDPLTRVLAWQALWNEVLDGRLLPAKYVKSVIDHIAGETDPGIIAWVINCSQRALLTYIPSAHESVTQLKIRLFDLCKDQYELTDGELKKIWRSELIRVGGLDSQIAEKLTGFINDSESPLDVRWRVLVALAANNLTNKVEIEKFKEEHPSTESHLYSITALHVLPDTDRGELKKIIKENTSLSNDELEAYIAAWRHPQRYKLEDIDPVEHARELPELWRMRSVEMGERVVNGLAPLVDASRSTVEPYKELLDNSEVSLSSGIERVIRELVFQAERILRIKASQN